MIIKFKNFYKQEMKAEFPTEPKEQLFNLRRKKAVGNLDNMLELKRIRKDIARIYTVLRERELGMNKEGN